MREDLQATDILEIEEPKLEPISRPQEIVYAFDHRREPYPAREARLLRDQGLRQVRRISARYGRRKVEERRVVFVRVSR